MERRICNPESRCYERLRMKKASKRLITLSLAFMLIFGNLIPRLSYIHAKASRDSIKVETSTSENAKIEKQEINATSDKTDEKAQEKAERGATVNAAQNINYEFNMRWANGVSDDVKDYHYTDESKKTLAFTPIDNQQKTATLIYSLKLKNDDNMLIPKGAIKIKVPAYIFKDWKNKYETRANYEGYLPVLKWQVPKAPETSTVSDFNYVDNGDGTLTVSNFKTVSGNATLSFEQGFTFVPSLVKLDKDKDGEETGTVKENVKASLSIENTPIKEEKELEISLHSKNTPTKISLKQANLDEYKGVYFGWQDNWGKRPADADDYFYVIWYADIQRGSYPKIPFDYEINPEDDGVGGKIVGIKKDNSYNENTGFCRFEYIDRNTDYEYNDIVKGDLSVLKQKGLLHEYTGRITAFTSLYGFDNGYTGESYTEHYARFSILKKYPKSIIEEEKKKGTDLAKDGFKLPNKISVTDTLKNGVVKKSEIVSADADIHIHNYEGKNNIWKWDSENSNGGFSNTPAGQDFLLQGLDVKVIGRYWIKSTFSIHTTTSAPEEPTLENGKAKSKPYTSTIEDGNLYHSTGFKNREDSYSNQFQFFEKLKDGDYSYKSIYFDLKEYDAKKTDGGWFKITNPSKDYEHFKPIDIFVRYGGENSYTKLGQITFDKDGNQNYLSEDGNTEIKNVTADNPVVFPKNVVNLKYSHKSTFFESDLYARPTLMLHPTDNLKKLIQDDKDKSKERGRYYTAVSSDAKLTLSTDDGKTIDSSTKGQLMERTTVIINPLEYGTHIGKSARDLVDDVSSGKQTLSVSAYIANLMNLWDSGNPNFEYMDKYTAKKLAFYDLLPAGTYVEPNSIIVHGGHWSWNINEYSIVDKSAYTVEYKENWEGSGQTMMIVTVDFPQKIREFYKISANHGNSFYIDYKLVNTYNNISDRGNSVINTIGIKNLSDDVKFKSNAKDSNVAKKDLYKSLIKDEYDKWNLVQETMNYNPVTIKQAGVVKKAANDHDNELKEKTNVFPGNKYRYNLAYTMASETRADQIIIYDILENGNNEEKSEWKGKLDWVDLSSIKQKPAYNHPGETCEPVLYISKLAPDKIKLDVSDSSVWERVEADKLSEKDKITAIAIDCRKTNRGESFVLDRGMGIQADVHMVAPDDDAIIEKTAVNKTDIQARTFNGLEPNTTDKANLYEESAKVLAKKLDISFTKESDPFTGTKENPFSIDNKVGDSIRYTLSIKNNDPDLDIRNIAMEDVIPEGLTPDLDNILVTAPAFKLDKAKLSGLAQASVKETGQKLDFSIGSLPAGESIIFEIPTKIEKEFFRTTLFDNTAKITNVENKERKIESDTTYHKVVKQYKLNYVVKADKNHGIPTNSKTPDEVTGIEYDETKTLAKPLETDETVDNKGVKGVWTFKGWAEKADDIDNSPIDKVKILKDTTVYGQWEFNPTRNISVEKKWEDAKMTTKEGEEKILKKATPQTVTVELYRDDKNIEEKELTDKNNWKCTFENLPVAEKEGANPYKYTVKEKEVDENNKIKLSNSWYKANIQGDADNGFTITNKVLPVIQMEPPTRTVKVTKEWLNDKKTKMPLDKIKDNKITVELYRDGKPTGKTAELNAATNWTASFDKLPVSETVDSQAYTYTIVEKGVSTDKKITLNGLSYKSEVSGNQKDGFKLSNTLINSKISVSGEKIWKDKDDQDGIRPGKITVNLYANDKFTGKSVEVTKDGKWKYSFENLPIYDEKGDRLSYTVKEDKVKDYTSEISEAKIDQAGNIVYDIVNSHKPLERSIQVKKIWVDDNNKKELRPDEIKVKLIADGNLENPVKILIIKANENDKWEAEFNNLPVNNKGKEIDYTVTEESVKNYKEVVTGTMQDGFTITNTIEGKKSIGITKKWIGKAKDSVEVILLQDGKEYKKAKITKDNNWQYTFADIDVYDNKDGHEYQYNVTEVAIEGYESKIEKVADGSYRLINKEILCKKSTTPKTGYSSNLALYGTLMGLSGLLLIAVGIKKRRKES